MTKPLVSIVAAIGKNRELGKNNKLLWHIPEDLKRFKQLTSGHPIIMGRKTFESIGRPLPNRANIVITRDKSFQCHSGLGLKTGPEGLSRIANAPQNDEKTQTSCEVVYSLDEALRTVKENDQEEIFIIGGGQIFEQAMPLADRLYLTIVDATFDADVYFPDYSMFTKVISEEKGESNGYKYTFLELVK